MIAEPLVQEPGSILDRVLLKLHDLNLKARQVRRVAVTSEGSLHLEIAEGNKQRFFVYGEPGLIELQAENDAKIPLAAKLNEADFAAGHAIISYRPGRRIVLAPRSDDPAIIYKGYKRQHAVQAAKNHTIVSLASEQGGFNVPELLRCETRDDYLVMARHDGHPPLIAAHAVGTWSAIGACLQGFQQANGNAGLKAYSAADELMVLDERARRFLMCMPSLPGGWLGAREKLQNMAGGLPPAQLGLAHRDLHDGQFLVTGKTISLLDFDLLCSADVALDAGNLLAHMQLRALQGRHAIGPSALTACREAFLSGLGRRDEPGFEKRLCFYQASSFCRLALLYALRPRWSHLGGPLLTGGYSCIEAFHENRGWS